MRSAIGLMERASCMLDEIASKTVHKYKELTDRGKRRKTLNEAKPVEEISKNPQNFFEIRPRKKEVLSSHKLLDQAYE